MTDWFDFLSSIKTRLKDVPGYDNDAFNEIYSAIGQLNIYREDFLAALRLFGFSNMQLRTADGEVKKAHAEIAVDPLNVSFGAFQKIEDKRKLMNSWAQIAARDGAITLFNFGKQCQFASQAINVCPALDRARTRPLLRQAHRVFKSIPGTDHVRDGVAHMAEFANSDSHQMTESFNIAGVIHAENVGSFFLAGTLIGSRYHITYGGHDYFYDISPETVAKLDAVIASFLESVSSGSPGSARTT